MRLWVMTRSREMDGFVGLEAEGLAGAKLARLDLRQAYLNHTDLRGVRLERVDLRGAFLIGADLTSAHLEDVALIGTHLVGATLRDARVLDAGGQFLRLDQADLRGFAFTGTLEHAELPHAWLEGADLTGADLRHANLTGARWDGATRWPEGFSPDQTGATRADSPSTPRSAPRLTEEESLQVVRTLAERAERFATRHELRASDRFVVPLPDLDPVGLEGLRLMAARAPRA